MHAPVVLAAVSGLLVVISLIQPLARRLAVTPSVLLAVVGVAIGFFAAWLLSTPQTDAFNEIAAVFVAPPLDSQGILHVFLPLLLFQTTLTLDVRRMAEDGGVILVMAVVAVLVATAVIGLALAPFSPVPLIACLMLGAIVATTDPVAVVSIFRDIGAPARLVRLVEGESLLNDAAAIALFVILLGALTSGTQPDPGGGLLLFVWVFAGGIVLGYAGGQMLTRLLLLVRDFRLAQVTLTVALPYLVYLGAEHLAGVSGVVAVVTSGIVLNAAGPSRVTPDGWGYLNAVWDQIAFWAASLVFMLASILIPRLLIDVGWMDLVLLLILVAAALTARAIVLFALLPLLSTMKLAQPVSMPFKTVMLWGGMRGAITLTLALGVTENPAIDPDVQRFVAVMATGFVLFTLLVFGTTLKPLIRILGLDRLSPLDSAVRAQVLALAQSNTQDGVARAARTYGIADPIAAQVQDKCLQRMTEATGTDRSDDDILDRDRITIGLVSLTNRERELVLEHLRERTASIHTTETLLAQIGRIGDRARSGGRVEYNRAAREALAFPIVMRLAQLLQRSVKYDRWLGRMLADRYEMLLLSRIVLDELKRFITDRIEPLLGQRVAELLSEILQNRRDATHTALEALRLQYPDYADELDRRFLQKTALRLEEDGYRALLRQNLIGAELHAHLTQSLQSARVAADRRPPLDMGMRTQDLTAQVPLFRDLPQERIQAIAQLMTPRLAVPGDLLIRKGERGDAAYFISSGAVEVTTGGRRIRLGRGDVFGEIALLTGERRNADVRALGYCNLLVLSRSDFASLMQRDPGLRAHIAQVAEDRTSMNESGQDPSDGSDHDTSRGTKV